MKFIALLTFWNARIESAHVQKMHWRWDRKREQVIRLSNRFPQNRTLDSKKGADKHSPLRLWVVIADRNVSLSHFLTRKWSLLCNLFNHTNELEPPTSLWKGEGRMQWGAGISE